MYSLDSLMMILGHHCVAILLVKMLIWTPFSQSMWTFSFCINPWYDALEMMNMKEVKMITWCPTWMATLLDTCDRTVGLLFLLCDVLASRNVKQEERAYFMSPLCLAMHLLGDLKRVRLQLVIVICAHVVKVYNNYASTLIIYKVNRPFSFLPIIYFP